MSPDEELLALRRLAELQAPSPPRELGSMGPEDVLSSVKEGAKTVGTSLLRGAGLGAKALLSYSGAGQIDPKTYQPVPSPVATKFGEWLDRALPPQEGFEARVLEGAGGGLGGGGLRQTLARMFAGAAGTAAGEATARFNPIDNPTAQKVLPAVAGLLVGGATGAALGPGATRTPEQRATADTQKLIDLALNRIGPQAAPEAVANRAGNLATQVLGNARSSVGGELGQTLENLPRLTPGEAWAVQQAILQRARRAASPEDAQALEALAGALTSNRYTPTPAGAARAPLMAPQDLSLAVKRFKENPPTLSASSGTKIEARTASGAARAAEEELGRAIPGYEPAMNRYAGRMAAEVAPLEEGVIGKLAGNRPYEPDPLTPGALGQILTKQSPQAIEENLGRLGTAQANLGPIPPGGDIRQQIARALLQEKLAKGPLAPGASLYGNEGSMEAQRINALLSGAGVNPQSVTAPLRAADIVPSTLPRGGTAEALNIHPGGLNVRAILRPDIFKRMAGTGQLKEAVGELLQTATPAERAQLSQLSMFDPSIRKLLAVQGAAIPLLQQESQ